MLNLKQVDSDLFIPIYNEFEGVQKERVLKIINNECLSDSELRSFYSNLLIKMKLNLREYLYSCEMLLEQKREMKRRLKKYKNDGISVDFLNMKYIDPFMKIERELNSLNQIISQIGVTLLNMIKVTSELKIFDEKDISSIYSMPISMVKDRVLENGSLNKKTILDLIVKDFAEFAHVERFQKDNIFAFPFYWCLNSSYIFTADRTNIY